MTKTYLAFLALPSLLALSTNSWNRRIRYSRCSINVFGTCFGRYGGGVAGTSARSNSFTSTWSRAPIACKTCVTHPQSHTITYLIEQFRLRHVLHGCGFVLRRNGRLKWNEFFEERNIFATICSKHYNLPSSNWQNYKMEYITKQSIVVKTYENFAPTFPFRTNASRRRCKIDRTSSFFDDGGSPA